MDSGNAKHNAPDEDARDIQPLLAAETDLEARKEAGGARDGGRDDFTALGRAFTSLIWDRGIVCIVVASALFSVAAAFVKPLPTVPVFEIVLVRSVLSLCFTAGVAKAQGLSPRKLLGRRENLPALVARGVVGSSAMTCFYLGIARLPLSDSIAILYSNPALTAALAFVLLGEKFGALTAGGCGLSVVGVLLVDQPVILFGEERFGAHSGGTSVGLPDQRSIGLVFAALAALLSSGAFIAIRSVGRKEAAITVAVHFHASACALSAVCLAAGWPEPPRLLPFFAWGCLVGIAFCSFGANLLLSRGYQITAAARASAANYTQVLFSAALGVTVFGEELTWLSVAGAACIAAGVLAVSVNTSPERRGDKAAAAQSQELLLSAVRGGGNEAAAGGRFSLDGRSSLDEL
jgi:drug/metabolite transporter (DMT)-like permease